MLIVVAATSVAAIIMIEEGFVMAGAADFINRRAGWLLAGAVRVTGPAGAIELD